MRRGRSTPSRARRRRRGAPLRERAEMNGRHAWPRPLCTAAACVVLAVACPQGQTRDSAAATLVASPQFKKAAAFIRGDHARFVRELITLTEIPAPPFKEERRGLAYLD